MAMTNKKKVLGQMICKLAVQNYWSISFAVIHINNSKATLQYCKYVLLCTIITVPIKLLPILKLQSDVRWMHQLWMHKLTLLMQKCINELGHHYRFSLCIKHWSEVNDQQKSLRPVSVFFVKHVQNPLKLNLVWQVSKLKCGDYLFMRCDETAQLKWDQTRRDEMTQRLVHLPPPCYIFLNKANLRDLIAATGLVISNWIQIVNFSARVTVKFDWWPCKTIGHLFYATSSFVHHFVAIGEYKLELQSGNTRPIWVKFDDF